MSEQAPALLILASASPRRRELLAQIGMRFRVEAVAIDESVRPGETPEGYVMRLAAEKSRLAAEPAGSEVAVLGADTAVVLDRQVFGKPTGQAEARAMLSCLSGRWHQVLTAVSLRCCGEHWQALSQNRVRFRALSEQEITAYWASGEPADKAGAYALQGMAAMFVERIEGSYSGVVGLPLYETAQLLRKAGFRLLGRE